ncbi:MAG: zf-HC2 domain-containing protein [Planctomycetes bacterium]|nr:zf-HC2 domain-containing protein [Planctomycetota bacterium]
MENLSALLDGELPPAEATNVRTHAEGCAPCRAALADLRAIDGDLRTLLATSVSDAPVARAARSAVAALGAARRTTRPRWPAFAALAACALVALVAAEFAILLRAKNAPYAWRAVQGTLAGASSGNAAVGDVIECLEGSRARLTIGDLGEVEVEAGTRLRVVDCGRKAHELYLERGTIRATIVAEPRLFRIGTPAGLAVDLGCAYSLAVDGEGVAMLRVHTGAVSFEREGARTYVPSGASCAARPDGTLPVPLWDDAPEPLRRCAASPDVPDLAAALASARDLDTLTLWHLLRHPAEDVREAVYERLAGIEPPPAGVTREQCLAREARALDAWLRLLRPEWPGNR